LTRGVHPIAQKDSVPALQSRGCPSTVPSLLLQFYLRHRYQLLDPWNFPALLLQSSLHLKSKSNSNHPPNEENSRPKLPSLRRTNERKNEFLLTSFAIHQTSTLRNKLPQFYNRRERTITHHPNKPPPASRSRPRTQNNPKRELARSQNRNHSKLGEKEERRRGKNCASFLHVDYTT
jgi:hypothetical protein